MAFGELKTRYDYIIAGAGSAGCVLARRLSDAGHQVLLLEVGGSDKSWIIQMPAGLRSAFKPTSKYNWWFYTQPQKHLNNRKIQQPRGRVLGGSSSINGMTWLRGHPLDYDRWQQEGAQGWSWENCLPYFKKIENSTLASDYRGLDGPIGVQRQEQLSPLNAAFLEAGQQAGWPLTEDVNGYQQEGVSRFEMSVKNGIRNSAAFGYLHKRIKTDNLTIWIDCQILKINIQNSTASGCQVSYKGKILDVFADKETLLCAGVFGSPQLLMLSGVGAAEQLAEHAIECKVDLPGVGENLQDHLECHIQIETKQPVSLNRELQPHRMLWATAGCSPPPPTTNLYCFTAGCSPPLQTFMVSPRAAPPHCKPLWVHRRRLPPTANRSCFTAVAHRAGARVTVTELLTWCLSRGVITGPPRDQPKPAKSTASTSPSPHRRAGRRRRATASLDRDISEGGSRLVETGDISEGGRGQLKLSEGESRSRPTGVARGEEAVDGSSCRGLTRVVRRALLRERRPRAPSTSRVTTTTTTGDRDRCGVDARHAIAAACA